MTKDEEIRKKEVAIVNGKIESGNPDGERARLEDEHGQVWDTQQIQEDFTVHSFAAPYISVTRKSDKVKGTMVFQHLPRFYFSFKAMDPQRM